VEEIRKRLDYTFGFSATAGAVDSWIYETAHETYVADTNVRERMKQLNIHAYSGLVRRLVEAADREFWPIDQERLEELREMAGALEDEMEGVV
jgi:magnesium chelatase subunit H